MAKRYVINPWLALRGWKKLPYALQDLRSGKTEFLSRNVYELLLACDGKSPFDPKWSSPEELQLLERWEKNHIIHECEEGQTQNPEQEYRYYDNAYKETVHWSITGKCNYRCRHCFMSAPSGVQGEPSFDQLIQMLDAFERCGIKTVQLTGGEPLIRRDFFDLVDAIRDRNILISAIYTNGHLVTESFLAKLKERQLRPMFQMSFDGIGWHDWMRGIDGAQETVLNAMKRCRDMGFPVAASMVLFRENRSSIRETVKLLADIGCVYLKISGAIPAGEWLNETSHYLSQEELFEAFLDYIPQYYEDGKPLSINMEGMFSWMEQAGQGSSMFEKDCDMERFDHVLMCGQMRRQIYVSPQGIAEPCMSMIGLPLEEQFPNLLEIPLEEILEDSYYAKISGMRVSDYMERNEECRNCSFKERCCGGCRAAAAAAAGDDPWAKDPGACLYFRGGFAERKKQLLEQLNQNAMMQN